MPEISVIIPSYNHEKYIGTAIQSVLEQTYQDFEIVITDDGSSDKSIEVIQSFNDSRIKLHKFSLNQGASIATNHCITHSRGKYIAVLNSDDVFYSNKLKVQLEFLKDNPNIGAVFSLADFIDEYGNLYSKKEFSYQKIFNQPNRTRYEWLNYFFNIGNCLCHPSVLIRRECYDKVGLFDPRFAQLPDLDFWIRLCKKYEIYIFSKSLVKFRLREQEANTSAVRNDTRIRHTFEYFQILQKNYTDCEIIESFDKIFPDYKNKVHSFDSKLAQFQIALTILNKPSPAHKLFAINLLYFLMEDPLLAERIKEYYGFLYTDLNKLSSEVDIFNIISNEEYAQIKFLIKNKYVWKIVSNLKNIKLIAKKIPKLLK